MTQKWGLRLDILGSALSPGGVWAQHVHPCRTTTSPTCPSNYRRSTWLQISEQVSRLAHFHPYIIPIVVSLHYSTLSGGISDCTVHPHHELLGTEQVLSLPASCARMCQVLLRSRSVAATPGSNRVDLA